MSASASTTRPSNWEPAQAPPRAGSPQLAAREGSPFHTALPHISPAFGRLLRFALLTLLIFSAARFGWGAGGAGLSIAAVGAVGLFTVPLIVGE